MRFAVLRSKANGWFTPVRDTPEARIRPDFFATVEAPSSLQAIKRAVYIAAHTATKSGRA